MNRKILFRGKRTDGKGWVEGDLINCMGVQSRIQVTVSVDSENITFDTFEVDPATVGQFTGLQDKTGKEVFEGDLIKSSFSKKPYPIAFGHFDWEENGEICKAIGFYFDVVGADRCPLSSGFDGVEYEVIGTIHDTPTDPKGE